MIGAYTFLLRPTIRRADGLVAMLDDHRAMYNAALAERRDAYRMREVSIRYGDQSAQLRDIRAFDPDHARWSFSSQQATLTARSAGSVSTPRTKPRSRWFVTTT